MTTPKPDTATDVGAQPPHVAPTRPAPRKATPKRKAAPQRKRAAKAPSKKKSSHPGKSKSDLILSLVGRPSGATLAEIMKATKWQRHSVRGFISLARSRQGLKITSTTNAKGEHVYKLAAKQGRRK